MLKCGISVEELRANKEKCGTFWNIKKGVAGIELLRNSEQAENRRKHKAGSNPGFSAP